MAPEPHSVLSHPIVLLLFHNVVSVFVLMFTSSSSVVRPGVLLLMLTTIWLAIPNFTERIGRVSWAAFAAGNTLTTALQYIELALVKKWTFDNQGRRLFVDPNRAAKGVKPPKPSWRERLYFGYFIALSTRHTATPWEVKGVPYYSSKDSTYVPTRARFLFKRAAIFVLCYLALDLAALGARSQHGSNSTLLSPQHIPIFTRIGKVSWEELATRAQETVGYYVFCYCLIQCYTSFLACITVALGIDKVDYWRPNFDRLGEAYNLRQFWGVSWHQHLRSKLSASSEYITYQILRLPKGSLITRYTNIFFTFFVSGVLHCLTIHAAGFTLWQSLGAFQYFCSQVLGIMIEDGVQALYRTIHGYERSSQPKPPRWARPLGFVWVLLFLIWSTPAFIFPMSAANKGEEKDEVLPFSPISMLQGTVGTGKISTG